VKNKMVASRMRAKRAIRRGLVRIDGRVVRDPSYDVKEGNVVEVDQTLANMPEGYWKLTDVEEVIGSRIVEKGDMVLDLGSSAGGFVYFCIMRGVEYVVGIEYSKKFSKYLKKLAEECPSFSFIMANAFYLPLKDLSRFFNRVLVDLTVEPEDTLKILEYLGSEGVENIFLTIKMGKNKKDAEDRLEREIKEKCGKYGYSVLNIVRLEKSEAHIILKRKM